MRCPHAIRPSEMLDGSQCVTRTHTNATACQRSSRDGKLRGEKQPSVCDNSSFTVSANNLQASLPITTTSVYIFHIHRETKKLPETWSAKTNPQPSLNKSSRCNGKEIPLKRAKQLLQRQQTRLHITLRLNICVRTWSQVLWMLSKFIPALRFETFSKFG